MAFLSTETIHVAAVVTFYMTAALVMIFVNKAVLNSSPTLPYLFLFLQMSIAVILLHLASILSPKVAIPTNSELTFHKAKKLAPVVLVNIIGLIFNTLCLRDVDASFFQIARGLVLPLTIIVSSLYTRTQVTLPVVLCAALVTSGFLIGVLPASFFSSSPLSSSLPVFSSSPSTAISSPAVSLAYGILSSLFIAVHAVLIKTSLPYVDGNTLKLAWWTNAGSAIALIPCIVLFGELAQLRALLHGVTIGGSPYVWEWRTFVWGSIVTGVFGFFLCVAGLLSIKVTSPVTHMFSSAAKGVLQTLLGVWIFNDLLTTTRASSILVILAGSMLYTWIKSHEGANSRDKSSISMKEVKTMEEGVSINEKGNVS